MDLGLKNRVIIVTGASRGIGKAIALCFGENHAKLTICSRNKEEITKIGNKIANSSGVEVLPIQADLTKKEDITCLIKNTFKKFKRIDILVNNTGGPPPMLFCETSNDHWCNTFELLFQSTINSCKEVIPYMKKQGWGRIINMTSIAAKQPMEKLILSNSIRAGILGLTKTLANELAQYGILVNAVCPGWTHTQRVEELAKTLTQKNEEKYTDIIKKWTKNIPLKRMAKPEEIASFVVFLASEKASYITGTVTQIDGGYIKSLL